MSRAIQIRHRLVSLLLIGGLLVAAAMVYPRLIALLKPPAAVRHRRASPLFKLTGPESIAISDEAVTAIGFELATVEQAPAPEPLRLPGYLMVDPNSLVPIHSRFPGQVVRVGFTEDVNIRGQRFSRPLRFGDNIKERQLLAIVWSTDIGQKKSELVDALSKLALDKTILDSFEQAPGAIPRNKMEEARRNVEADKIQVNAAKRTLAAWQLSEYEINEVIKEASELRESGEQIAAAKTWSELQIVAPRNGVILEKNVNEGEVVDTNENLFKIADLSTIQVLAYVYEEDLPVIETLKPAERRWLIDLKSDPNDKPREGMFSLIGSVIDQTMRTAPIVGWLKNDDHKLRVNQFVTATVQLPADPAMVKLPISALIEEGSTVAVFVESNPAMHEVTRRVVAVTRRGEKMAFIRADPNKEERDDGALPLRVGERVVISGVLQLDNELDILKSSPDDDNEAAE